MNTEITVLLFTAASIAFFHTLMGPDHYLPFIAIAKARGWSLKRTLTLTIICGVGHVVGSFVLGCVGVGVGLIAAKIEIIESYRGSIAAWLLISFGLVYFAWGMKQALKPHSHGHSHLSGTHAHTDKKKITPWVLFIIFVFGPCEPLIPILMYPGFDHSIMGMLAVSTVFCVVTVATMSTMVVLAHHGISKLSGFERFSHAFAGFSILSCGLSIELLGL